MTESINELRIDDKIYKAKGTYLFGKTAAQYAENEVGNFRIGASYGPAPRLLIGVDSASQNINCRCKKLYSVNGQMPEVRRTKDGLIKYQNYGEWLASKQ